jgi:hypothetical protein
VKHSNHSKFFRFFVKTSIKKGLIFLHWNTFLVKYEISQKQKISTINNSLETVSSFVGLLDATEFTHQKVSQGKWYQRSRLNRENVSKINNLKTIWMLKKTLCRLKKTLLIESFLNKLFPRWKDAEKDINIFPPLESCLSPQTCKEFFCFFQSRAQEYMCLWTCNHMIMQHFESNYYYTFIYYKMNSQTDCY